MKRKLLCAVALTLTMISPLAQAKLNVFACEPEWKALTEAIGGEQVTVSSATTAFQDPHHIEARPSLIAKTRRADLVVCTGSELEVGWLPLLLRQSANRSIQAGQPGYFLASELVDRIEVPEQMDRSLGDIHAGGNPHVHLDPYRLLSIAEALSQRLQQIDRANAAYYAERLENFKSQWLAAISDWENQATVLKGKKAVVYHKSCSYLLAWLGIEAIADLEPKPGIPPTSSHLVAVLQTVKTEKPDMILIAAYQDDKGAQWLADKSGIPVTTLPFTVGGNREAEDLQSLYQSTLSSLLNAINTP